MGSYIYLSCAHLCIIHNHLTDTTYWRIFLTKSTFNRTSFKLIDWTNYHQEVISLKKTLISGMFSSVSDAELVTELLDAADFNDNLDNANGDSNPDEPKYNS